jgi:hypothetical protein
MSTDLVLRTIGTLACVYMVGLFVSVMSFSAINAASNMAGSPCTGTGCHVAYQQRPVQAAVMDGVDGPELIHAAAIFVTEGF